MTPTPETHNELRERARLLEKDLMHGLISLVAFLDRKADEEDALRTRLEAAEKACRMLAALGLENDTVGEWPAMMEAYLAAKAALAGEEKGA